MRRRCRGDDLATKENMMRKILLANLAAAAVIFSTGALMPNRANAMPLDAAAGVRSAVEVANPIQEVRYYRRHFRHHRVFAFYPRRHFFRHHYRRSWWGRY